MIGNNCQAGHKKHDTLKVETEIGPMYVYDWDKYKDVAGYCTGKDDVSRTLKNIGVWEISDTQLVREILEDGDKKNWVWDFGCHIGWFTILAMEAGYKVFALDGDKENIDTLKRNISLNYSSHNYKPELRYFWIAGGKGMFTDLPGEEIELCKIDIEGNETYAISMIAHWLHARRIKNLLIEVSPIFNTSYPEMYSTLTSFGYNAFKDGQPFNGDFNFHQANIFFKRK